MARETNNVPKNPLVSIIIPTFNRRDGVLKAVSSGLNQSYKNIEVIVVDDCSRGNIFEVLSKVKDPRLQVYKNKKNSGVGFSRNFGFKKSKGDYINFLDDDDVLFKNKIAEQLDKFKESKEENLGIVLCAVIYKNSDNKLNSIRRNSFYGYLGKKLCFRTLIWGVHSPLIKRKAFDENRFDEKLNPHEEYDLFLRICQSYTVDFVDRVLCSVNKGPSLISTNFNKRFKATTYLFKKHFRFFLKKGFAIFLFNVARFTFLQTITYLSIVFGKRIYRGTLDKSM